MADELNTEPGGGTYGSTAAAEGWRRSAGARAQFLAPITERMLDLAGIALGSRVLDVASGTGEQTLLAARRIGPNGSVLAPSGGHAPFHVPTDPTIRCRFMLERPSLSSCTDAKCTSSWRGRRNVLKLRAPRCGLKVRCSPV